MFIGTVQCELEMKAVHPAFEGLRFLLVEPEHEVEWSGSLVVVDRAGADLGDLVLVALAPLGDRFDLPKDLPVAGAAIGVVSHLMTPAEDGGDGDATEAPAPRAPFAQENRRQEPRFAAEAPRGRPERDMNDSRGGPREDRSDRGPRDEGGERGLREDRGPREDRGDRGPREDRGDRGPREDRGDRGPREDRGDRGPREDRGDRRGRRGRGRDRSRHHGERDEGAQVAGPSAHAVPTPPPAPEPEPEFVPVWDEPVRKAAPPVQSAPSPVRSEPVMQSAEADESFEIVWDAPSQGDSGTGSLKRPRKRR